VVSNRLSQHCCLVTEINWLLVGVSIHRMEADTNNRVTLREDQAFMLAKLFNEHMTLIVDASIQSFTREELHGLMLASTGAQIDGSWRNAIGVEAEKVIQPLIINEAKKRNLLAALIPPRRLRDGLL
jgi:hypothetical protein